MQDQNDFLLTHKMPLLCPTLHPLDKNSQWNTVSSELEGTLTTNDYISLHYNCSVLGLSDLNTVKNSNLFSISENPIKNWLQLKFNTVDAYRVTLYNLKGQQLLQKEYNKIDNTTINTRFLKRGVYIVSSYSKNTKQLSNLKFIKQ